MGSREDANKVKVWDPAIRLFHWVLVILIASLWISGELGKLNIHLQLGVWALVLLLFRWVWGIVGSSTARFGQFVRGPAAIIAYIRAARSGTVRSIGHNPLGALSVLALLVVLSIQAVTGLFTSDDIFTDGPLVHLASSRMVSTLSTIHRIGGSVIAALVALHVAAVVFYAVVKKDDLVRAMITGIKRVPTGVEGIRFANPLLAVLVIAVSAGLVWGILSIYGA